MNRTAIAFLVATVTASWAGWTAQGWRLERQIQSNRAIQAESDTYTERENRKLERLRAQGVTDAINEANTRAISNLAAADRARDELDRLRVALAASGPGRMSSQSSPTRTDDTSAIAELLLACGSELQAVARAADGHASDAVILQKAWPK